MGAVVKEQGCRVVGRSVPRREGEALARGSAFYTVDFQLPRTLVGKILGSPYPHGRVTRLDVSRAWQVPGVRVILTPRDVPRVLYNSAGSMPSPLIIQDQPILTHVARYQGDWLAAVAAETEEAAREALSRIDLDLEPLPGVYTLDEALREGAPQVHEGQPNLLKTLVNEVGNVEQGLAQAELTFSGTYRTQIVQQLPMELTACLCQWDEFDNLMVWATTQVPHHDRRLLAQVLGLPISRVRVLKLFVGGGYGARQQMHQQPVCALLARAARRPVKMVYTREEDLLASTTRHASRYELQTGVNRDGRIVAMQAKALVDTGAYATHGPIILRATAGKLQYNLPHYRYDGSCVYTNNPPAGAFRGYGNTQFTFAREVHLDEVAHAVGMDPVEFRLLNHVAVGDRNLQGAKKGWMIESCGIRECAERAGERIGWDRRGELVPSSPHRRRGMGVAFAVHGSGASFNDMASATAILCEDGSLQIHVGAAEIGQGCHTTLAQIAAEEMGLSLEQVTVHAADTAFAPVDMGSYASRVAFVTGNAVRRATAGLKELLLGCAARQRDLPAEDLDVREGMIVSAPDGRPVCSIREVAWEAHYGVRRQTLVFSASYMAENNPPPFGVQFADVEVDLRTGKIQVLRVVAAYDVGRAINPRIVEGQIEGGVAQGVGFALCEELTRDPRTGKLLNGSLLEYKIPTALDLPRIEAIVVESYDPKGPFGAKSIGEAPILATAPAIANAVFAATGIRLRELPLTPWRVKRALSTAAG